MILLLQSSVSIPSLVFVLSNIFQRYQIFLCAESDARHPPVLRLRRQLVPERALHAALPRGRAPGHGLRGDHQVGRGEARHQEEGAGEVPVRVL